MKNNFFGIIALITIIGLTMACGGGTSPCTHTNTNISAATCLVARTCNDCGATVQAALGHNMVWTFAATPGLYAGDAQNYTCDRDGCTHTTIVAGTPIAGVTTLAEAVAHINNVIGVDGVQFFFLMDKDADFTGGIGEGGGLIHRVNRHLTLVGIGGERTITMTGGVNTTMFTLEATDSSFTLGNNITLQGRAAGSTAPLVRVTIGTFTMLPCSKITGHNNTSTTSTDGAVRIDGANAGFIMKGGSITGNTTSNTTTGAVSGLRVQNTNGVRLEGGSIRGNTGQGADVFVSFEQILDLSGTAIVGTLALNAFDDIQHGRVRITQGWSGQVTSLSLRGVNADMATNISWYIGKAVLQGAGAYNLVAADLAKFPLGNFMSSAATDNTQPISPTHRIVRENVDGRYVGVVRAK